jgi:hypothetical protein
VDLGVERGRPDAPLSDDGDGRPLRLLDAVDPRGLDRTRAAELFRDRLLVHSRAEVRRRRDLLRDRVDAQLPQRPLRPVPARFDRRGPGPHRRGRLRARGPDEAPLRLAWLELAEHAPPRDRPHVVRERDHARAVERHLVPGGLRAVVGVDLGLRDPGRPRPGPELRRPLCEPARGGVGDRAG